MIGSRIISTALAAVFLCGALIVAGAADNPHLYRISLQEQSATEPLVEAGIGILAAIPHDHALAELTEVQVAKVIRLGYAVQYVAPSLYEFSAGDETDDYYTYATLTTQLQAWATQYANIAVLSNLGTSWQGRTIWVLKISDNPLQDEDEVVCYVCGCHHGNEKISAEVPMYFINYLLTNYGINPDVTFYVDNREIWVTPVVNPDGYYNNVRNNAHNVDVNRNYSFHWGESATQPGPYAFSEPESQAVRDLNLAQHFTTSHSYHSYGEEILYPFAWAANHPSPDNAFYVNMVQAMCALNGYTPLISGNLYPHGGEMNDYLYAEKGSMAVTSEVWGGPNYNPPSSGILAVCQENLPTDLYQLQRAGGAQITGRITDSVTGNPLVAQYKIVQLWNPSEILPRYSEPQFGRYRHLLLPGTYTLEILKAGYATQTIPNLVVSGTTPTVRDVQLVATGWPNVDLTLTPINPPIQIPAVGGSFTFTVNMVNNSGAAQNFQVWIMQQLPNLSWQGPMLGPVSLNIPASANITRTRSQNVPGSAASGTYTYRGYIGSYTIGDKWDSSGFTYTKLTTGNGPFVNDWVNWGESLEGDGMAISQPSTPNLLSAAPNPFNPSTTISFELRAASHVGMKVWDTSGRLVATLADGWQEAGNHQATFQGSGLASGIYLVKLEAGGVSIVQKLVLMK